MSQESEGLRCHICNEMSNTENDLFAHLEKIHDFDLKQIADEQDGTENDEKCRFCGRIFTFKMSFVRHVARHGISEMKCYLCNAYNFQERNQSQFESHMSDIHNINIEDIKSGVVSDFNCNFCYYSFSTDERLKQHEEKNHSLDENKQPKVEKINNLNPEKNSAKNVCKAPIYAKGGICGKNVQVEWRPRQTGGVEMRAKNFCDEHSGT